MADSDDEYERRNVRDKFRHERSDYERRGDDKRGRDNWEDRSNWSRNRDRRDGYRETDRGQRDRRSPVRREGSPPQVKRMRREWGDDAAYPPHYEGPYGPPVHGAPPPFWVSGGGEAPLHGPKGPDGGEVLTQPPMMTFKHYLSTQDDNITEDEALKRFSDYKTDFKKTQIVDFFVVHKEEEWFRSKYHPDEFDKHQEECARALKNRCQAFMKVYEMNMLVSLDAERANEINRVLDAAVIFMEGGTEFDLKALDEEEPSDEGNVQSGTSPARPSNNAPAAAAAVTTKDANQDVKSAPSDVSKPDKAEENSEQNSCKEDPAENECKKEPEDSKTVANESDTEKIKADPSENNKNANDVSGQQNKKEKRYTSGSESESGSCSDSDNESAEPPPVAKEPEKPKEVEKEKVEVEDATPKPRALHKTLSIFLRNMAPSITKQEVEALCKRYPGFLRVAIQDPQPERRFARRGWVTFDRTVNVKDICWNINNIRLRECDMGPIVNREIKQRIRPINGLAVHRQAAKQDIKHAAKIIQNLDTRWKMWQDAVDEKKDEEKSFGFVSNNPVLKNITDFLVDEGNYEEEALLGVVSDGKDKEVGSEITIERDEEILKVLDRLLFYLRIVYSIDYYSTVEYPNEDEMPHRCGMMHARGTNSLSKITQADVTEWMSGFEVKIAPFLNMKLSLDDAEAIKLGKKSQDEEVEKFIVSNMQELAKDKWLCPLSGKKFKGPEFVRKHILTKHTDKIEEVKKEVVYFNNYLGDPRRPQLPEHPSSRQLLGPPPLPNMMPSFLGPPPPPSFYRPPGYPGRRGAPYGPQFYMRGPDPFRSDFRRELPNPRRDRGRPDPRAVINYNDLDAPADVD